MRIEGNMVESEIKRLPNFESLDDMVGFFDNQDWGDYLNQMPEVDFEVDIKRRVYAITLDIELADKLTEIARSKQISSEELVNTWVREKVLEQVNTEGL
jgi:hypothetical protein